MQKGWRDGPRGLKKKTVLPGVVIGLAGDGLLTLIRNKKPFLPEQGTTLSIQRTCQSSPTAQAGRPLASRSFMVRSPVICVTRMQGLPRMVRREPLTVTLS